MIGWLAITEQLTGTLQLGKYGVPGARLHHSQDRRVRPVPAEVFPSRPVSWSLHILASSGERTKLKPLLRHSFKLEMFAWLTIFTCEQRLRQRRYLNPP